MTDARPVIGFIGVGFMGHGMAANILRGGYPLWVRGNRNRQPVEDLLARGAQESESPRAMAEVCDIIHICLSNSPQVEAVIRGPDGILAAGKPGLVVLDATTADPASTLALAAEMEAAGMILVDAPLGRTPKEAEEGTLDAMIGATPEVLERIRPVVDCWAGKILHTGPVGTAHKMKLVMNFISMSYSALFSEALTLAGKSGLSPQLVQEVIGASRMSNQYFDTFMQQAVGRDPEAHKFTLVNGLKDVTYAARMAADAGVTNILGSAVMHYFTQANATGHGADFVPTLADRVAELNGWDLPAAVSRGANAKAAE